MQKLTITFVYGKDDTRKLKYRLTSDIPVGVMLEKLIGFQFIVDSADPKTFNVLHNGVEIEDLSKTFEECQIIDGDEVYLIPTVFDPIPPLPEVEVPVKKAPQKNHEHHRSDSSHGHNRNNRGRSGNYHGHNNKGTSSHAPKRNEEAKANNHTSLKPASDNQGDKKNAPVPFKNKNTRRRFNRKPGEIKK